jgi:MipA family protein
MPRRDATSFDHRTMHHLLHSAALVLLMGTTVSQTARAQNTCPAPGPDCAVVGKLNISVGVGLGGRTNPVRGKSDLLLPVIPHISYYGKRFFLENLELGYTLHEGKSQSLSVIAAPGYDRAFFFRGDLQNIFVTASGGGGSFLTADPNPSDEAATQEFRVSRRRTTYLVGPEWTFRHHQLVGQMNVLREATGEHQGYEVRAALSAPIIDTEGSLVVSAGLTWKSSKLVRYYYGVDGLYEPGSAFNPFLKLGYTLPLSDRWSFNAFAHYERLGSAIADSPIISDGGVVTAFAGFVYKAL